MKKFLIVIVIIGGLVAASSALVRAIDTTVPTLSASPDVGGPGFEFTLTVDDCVEGDSVSFEVYFQFETVGCDGGVATSSEFQATFPPGEQTVFATVSDGPLLLQDPIEPCDESGDRPCTVTTTIDVLPASLTADPDEGEPGFGFTMTLENCGIDPIVFDSIDLAIESDPGQVVEFVVPAVSTSYMRSSRTCGSGRSPVKATSRPSATRPPTTSTAPRTPRSR